MINVVIREIWDTFLKKEFDSSEKLGQGTSLTFERVIEISQDVERNFLFVKEVIKKWWRRFHSRSIIDTLHDVIITLMKLVADMSVERTKSGNLKSAHSISVDKL
jgi:hypothetical protein